MKTLIGKCRCYRPIGYLPVRKSVKQATHAAVRSTPARYDPIYAKQQAAQPAACGGGHRAGGGLGAPQSPGHRRALRPSEQGHGDGRQPLPAGSLHKAVHVRVLPCAEPPRRAALRATRRRSVRVAPAHRDGDRAARRLCYEMCTQRAPNNWSEQLYQRHAQVRTGARRSPAESLSARPVSQTITEYLQKRVVPALSALHGAAFLAEFAKHWQNHLIMNKWMRLFFMYLVGAHVALSADRRPPAITARAVPPRRAGPPLRPAPQLALPRGIRCVPWRTPPVRAYR